MATLRRARTSPRRPAAERAPRSRPLGVAVVDAAHRRVAPVDDPDAGAADPGTSGRRRGRRGACRPLRGAGGRSTGSRRRSLPVADLPRWTRSAPRLCICSKSAGRSSGLAVEHVVAELEEPRVVLLAGLLRRRDAVLARVLERPLHRREEPQLFADDAGSPRRRPRARERAPRFASRTGSWGRFGARGGSHIGMPGALAQAQTGRPRRRRRSGARLEDELISEVQTVRFTPLIRAHSLSTLAWKLGLM